MESLLSKILCWFLSFFWNERREGVGVGRGETPCNFPIAARRNYTARNSHLTCWAFHSKGRLIVCELQQGHVAGCCSKTVLFPWPVSKAYDYLYAFLVLLMFLGKLCLSSQSGFEARAGGSHTCHVWTGSLPDKDLLSSVFLLGDWVTRNSNTLWIVLYLRSHLSFNPFWRKGEDRQLQLQLCRFLCISSCFPSGVASV